MEKLSENAFYRKKLRRAVEARDADKNGLITRADFEKTIQRHRDLGVPEEHLKIVRAMFSKLCDTLGLTDDSISLTYEEFEEIHMSKSEEVKDKGVAVFRELFRSVDIDEDGEISYEEWVHHYKALNIDVAHARASFDVMDTNSDGKISMEEFIAYHTEYYHTAEDKLNSSILFGPMQ